MVCLLVLLVCSGCLLLPPPLPKRTLTAIEQLASFLRRVDTRLRSGEVDWQPQGESALDQVAPGCRDLLDQAWRLGLGLGSATAALQAMLAQGRDLLQQVQALRALFAVRCSASLLLAAAVHTALRPQPLAWASTPMEAAACALAAAVAICGKYVFEWCLPCFWLMLHGQMTVQGRAWLSLHLGLEAACEPVLSAELNVLEARELTHGVSLKEQKRLVLNAWHHDALFTMRQRLRRMEDLLPAFELVAIGLPMLLLLIAH